MTPYNLKALKRKLLLILVISWLLAYCFLNLGFSVLSFTNEHIYMNSLMNKLNALDWSVVKLQRQWDLLRWLGGPNSVVRHVGGSIEGEEEEKKGEWRELPRRSPRYEIGPFSSRSPFLLKKKITKIKWGKNAGPTAVTVGAVGQRRAPSVFLPEEPLRSTLHAQSCCPRARARVCVYKCLNWCHKRGEEGG